MGSGISKSQQGFPLTLPTQVAPPPINVSKRPRWRKEPWTSHLWRLAIGRVDMALCLINKNKTHILLMQPCNSTSESPNGIKAHTPDRWGRKKKGGREKLTPPQKSFTQTGTSASPQESKKAMESVTSTHANS